MTGRAQQDPAHANPAGPGPAETAAAPGQSRDIHYPATASTRTVIGDVRPITAQAHIAEPIPGRDR